MTPIEQQTIKIKTGHHIDGALIGASGSPTFKVWDPNVGEPIAELPVAGQTEVDAAVHAAREGQRAWWSRAPTERESVIGRIAAALTERAEELGRLESLNTGKRLSSAVAEIQACAEIFGFYAGFPTKNYGQQVPVADRDLLCYSVPEPVGVVAAITPWNYPLVAASVKVAPALAAGCGIVLKPAPETPLSAIELAEIAAEAGVPAGAFNVVVGDGETGALLAGHPGVDKVAFTGSTATGRSVQAAAAANGHPAMLELGGKSPNLVFDDIDLEASIDGILAGALWNAGQECCAGARILVHEGVWDEFLALAKARIEELRVGPGTDESADVGPLISARHQRRVRGFVERAIQEGAVVHAEGSAPAQGYFFAPTLLSGIEPQMEVWCEEVFGPVIAVDRFTTDDEALEKANGTRYGLAAGVWTGSVSRSLRFARDLDAGLIWINSYLSGSFNAPFGGRKDSGFGRELGLHGALEFVDFKTVFMHGPPTA